MMCFCRLASGSISCLCVSNTPGWYFISSLVCISKRTRAAFRLHKHAYSCLLVFGLGGKSKRKGSEEECSHYAVWLTKMWKRLKCFTFQQELKMWMTHLSGIKHWGLSLLHMHINSGSGWMTGESAEVRLFHHLRWIFLFIFIWSDHSDQVFRTAGGTSSFYQANWCSGHVGGMSAPSDAWCQCRRLSMFSFLKINYLLFDTILFPLASVCVCVRARDIWLWLEQCVSTPTCAAAQHLNNFRL